MLARPVEEMQIVYQTVPATPGEKDGHYLRLLVTAAPKELVMFYTAIFQKAGFQLEELETEAFALERSLVGRDPATVMVVDMGSERTSFFIIDQGLPFTHRSIQVGGRNIDAKLKQMLGVGSELIGQIKRDLCLPGVNNFNWLEFEAIIDPIIKEIEYGFNLYFKQSGNQNKKPEKIILTGGAAVFPPIRSHLEKVLGIKVFVGDPWARVVYQQGLKNILDEIGPRMSVAIGLALRNIK
jgi:type IV pilus assembly protein PilM